MPNTWQGGFLRDSVTGALVVSGGGGGGGAVTPYKPETYGAKRDGVTDDTAAIKACVQAACDAAVADGTYYAEVQFTSGIYQLSGSLTQGGSTLGNALIPLPVFPDTGQKMILVLKGSADNAPLWHWNQTTVQSAGVVLRTTKVGTNDATYGAASVIGGPTPQQGYGAASNVWSNMLIVVDGIQITVPNNPAISGFDFRGLAQMNFKNGACLANATPATRTATGSMTSAWQFGLATPQNNNNASSTIGKYSAEALNFGAYISEHCTVGQLFAIYCVAGIEFGDGNGTGHGILVHHACIEACDVGVGAITGAFPTKVKLDRLDFENISFALVNDASNALLGEINASGIGNGNLLQYGTAGPYVNGALNCIVRDMGRQKGVQTSPAIPATTVALRNPFFRDAFVHINGGTVSLVQITDSGGTAKTVATTTGVPVLLPANASITLTYTVVPTSWTWTII